MEVKQWRAEEVIGGNAGALKVMRELITFPHLFAGKAEKLGLGWWPRGLLLYGPPGTGKTSMVRAVVQECGAHLTEVDAVSICNARSGGQLLCDAFSEASSYSVPGGIPSVIFIDEIDALFPGGQQSIRMSAQLSRLMDSINSGRVVVVGSTNRVDVIELALRRPRRFDFETEVAPPNAKERFQILKLHTKNARIDSNVDLEAIAVSCNGFVGADLEDLCRQAAMFAIKRSSDANENADEFSITLEDWKHARSVVVPSLTKGVVANIPDVTWEDIAGLKDLKRKLQVAVEWPIEHAASYGRLGVRPVRGILLHGPPGCSKTTLAKAAVHAAQASFFPLSCADLYSKYVGEGEALLRKTFSTARLAAPSIILLDEVDSIAMERGISSNKNRNVEESLVSTLLTEMDGLEEAKGILVLATTNRPQVIDTALMRPGRFDLVLHVPPPDLEDRYEILLVHTRKMNISDDVDLLRIAEDTELFTGAELKGLCVEAGMLALREDISASLVCDRHFQTVKGSMKPSLTKADYESSFKRYSSLRST